MMRISNDAKELAERRYVQAAERLSAEHYRNIQRHEQTMPRGGAMQGAIDREHLTMAREIALAYVDCHLEVFVAEGLIPDANDLREMRTEINKIVARHEGSEFWTPRPATAGALTILPDQIYGQLANRVRQMELESRMPTASVPAAPSIHIGGHNFGAIQQGGQNNSQSVTINAQLNSTIEELLNRIDSATDLTAFQKLKASTDLRYVQDLTALEASEKNQEEARSKLNDITSILSTSADLVSLGIPTIQIIRAFFGL
jgi:hypothetical protein